MTFRASNGSRLPYSAVHEFMVGLRLPTTLFRWRDSLYVLLCFVLRVRMLIDRITTFGSGCPEFGHTVIVWRGVLRSMLQCPIGSVVTVPYFPLCYVTCYVATIVSLEARYVTVRSSFGPTSGVWLWQWQVAYVDLDAE